MSKVSDFMSIRRFAEMFSVLTKTPMRWINEENIFKGCTVRRNQTLFLA